MSLDQDARTLGEFRLSRRLATGGMAEVWEAHHPPTGAAVAIKIMTHDHAWGPRFTAAFRQEVRAIAGLDHPHIVRIFEQGSVPAQVAEHSGGRWREGTPWLAMELATGGTLGADGRALTFPELYLSLLQILDALAHAHARGLVHLDLKPGNVLCAGQGLGQLKLSDFGIAHALEPTFSDGQAGGEPTLGAVVGTPSFMAPEQFSGAWRHFGPWTDLYALGCMAYRLASGQNPFTGRTTQELMKAHYVAAPPPLRTPTPMPAGLSDWILQLLEKSPEDRFQCAADAAAALRSLSGGHLRALQPWPHEQDDGQDEATLLLEAQDQASTLLATLALGPPGAHAQATDATELSALRVASALPTQPTGSLARWQRPRVPAAWSSPQVPPHPLGLTAGASLIGLRQVPLVDRENERNALWQALFEVHTHGRPRLVLLRGGPGTGKSRLAHWLAERASETGAATPLRAHHSPERSQGEGLPRMLAGHLRLLGLPVAGVRWRLERSLEKSRQAEPLDAALLLELVSPLLPQGEEPPPAGQVSPAARHGAVVRLLAGLAAPRPLVMVLDDVQWGADALRLVEALLRFHGRDDLPILILATVQEEALADAPTERALLEAIEPLPGVKRLDVKPLPDPEQRGLIDGLLPLEPALRQRVVSWSAGHPLLAVQLVGGWVQQGVLVRGARGLGFPEGQEPSLPADLHAVWMARVEGLLAGLPPGAGELLELAAALGREVDLEAWRVVASSAGIGWHPWWRPCSPSGWRSWPRTSFRGGSPTSASSTACSGRAWSAAHAPVAAGRV